MEKMLSKENRLGRKDQVGHQNFEYTFQFIAYLLSISVNLCDAATINTLSNFKISTSLAYSWYLISHK